MIPQRPLRPWYFTMKNASCIIMKQPYFIILDEESGSHLEGLVAAWSSPYKRSLQIENQWNPISNLIKRYIWNRKLRRFLKSRLRMILTNFLLVPFSFAALTQFNMFSVKPWYFSGTRLQAQEVISWMAGHWLSAFITVYVFLHHLIPGEGKICCKELGLSSGPLDAQTTTLTTWPRLLGPSITS